MKMDERYMREALKEAEKAKEDGEVPVGAVVVHEGRIIARAHNQRERLKDPTAHAEMIAITQAASSLQSWRLTNCTMYVTKEPCLMCVGALIQARVSNLIYGALDPKAGALGSKLGLNNYKGLNHHIKVTKGILEGECSFLLKDFFKGLRSH